MFDPLTVAFEIKYPWCTKTKHPNEEVWKYYAPFITIWHKDPCKDGSDDSCDWFYSKFTKKEKDHILKLRDMSWAETVFVNYEESDLEYDLYAIARHLRQIWYHWPWWKHPRFHFWHWKIQVHPIQKLKRFLFSRCNKCGKRFKWDEEVVGTWDGNGPRWFKSEKVWHFRCDPTRKDSNDK